jgi:hypothetical protein
MRWSRERRIIVKKSAKIQRFRCNFVAWAERLSYKAAH